MAGLLVRVLTWFASGLIFRALSALGVGIFSMYFINDILSQFISSMNNAVSSLPADVISILGIAGFDKYLSIVLGALVTVTYLRSMRFMLTRQL
ncbi:DUF2523 domain-containing protein [Acinetobacter pittii]|uniref:DUF2523 domain-containing protein n=1 Tax=Acinetobacter pittii TaxID=48296 RepID=A0A8I1L0E6_ACIPI|nr:DUF2523 domain-containing protein [Acinetobacter pittii]OIF72052.1 hypothetical protein A7N09_22445 [Acinetobacter baumannii]AVN21966.1 DUF2523 domain-containing protein [Acinetobacter pittii]KQE60125.1 hypothetical protein APD49_14855 [Acinetobacter pittii]MBK0408737.1 DUF2523 domain-containing protein [Acinetobacter pittii]MBK1443282.1 DUF2523 domain-containing protein [Acinetobacter pittii]